MPDGTNRVISSVFTNSKALLSIFFVFCLTVFALHRIGRNPQAPREEAPGERRCITTEGMVRKGKPLILAMQSSGIDPSLAYEIVSALGESVDLRKCRPGERFILEEGDNGEFIEFRYVKSEKDVYKVVKEMEKYVSVKVEQAVQKRVERIRAKVRQNLYDTILCLGERAGLVVDLVDIFSWEIDFAADVRDGDDFDFLVEKEYIGEKFVEYGEILVAKYRGYFGEKAAFLFEYGGSQDYYDVEGQSLRRAIMRAPLSYTRISSKFSPKRLHPILKVWRPHYGVDYAAPRGTPVMAAGDGVVKFAGWKGAYGYYIRVRHPNGYETGYGHLLRMAKGIKVGNKVSVKQVIGWVGSTGLSTGPHLQYEVLCNGKYVNPLTMKLPAVRSLAKGERALFKEHVERMTGLLENWDSLSAAERQWIYSEL